MGACFTMSSSLITVTKRVPNELIHLIHFGSPQHNYNVKSTIGLYRMQWCVYKDSVSKHTGRLNARGCTRLLLLHASCLPSLARTLNLLGARGRGKSFAYSKTQIFQFLQLQFQPFTRRQKKLFADK